jgi:hypothetical protein
MAFISAHEISIQFGALKWSTRAMGRVITEGYMGSTFALVAIRCLLFSGNPDYAQTQERRHFQPLADAVFPPVLWAHDRYAADGADFWPD